MRLWVWLGLAVLVGCKDSAPGVCNTDRDCAGGGVCTAYRTCVDAIDVPVGSRAPGSCAEPLPPSRCALPRGEPWALDHRGARNVLPGRWLRCSGPGVIEEPGAVGLEFTQAGQWFQLVAGSDGRIERAPTASISGIWQADQVGSDWQLMLFNVANGIAVFNPGIVRNPLMMRPVWERPDIIYVYAPTADCGGSPAPDASAPEAAPSGPCAEPLPPPACEQPSTKDIIDQNMSAMFPGRWLYCGGFPLVAPEAIGFEATSDGRWYRLTTDEQGRLVRATGFDSRGRWETLHQQGEERIDMYSDTGGGQNFKAEFRDNPRNLFAVSPGNSSRYVQAPAPRCP